MGQPQDATVTFKEHIKSQTHTHTMPTSHTPTPTFTEQRKGIKEILLQMRIYSQQSILLHFTSNPDYIQFSRKEKLFHRNFHHSIPKSNAPIASTQYQTLCHLTSYITAVIRHHPSSHPLTTSSNDKLHFYFETKYRDEDDD